jgi:hypothetical protein
VSTSLWTDAPKNSQQVFTHLVNFARKMRVVTYGEVASAIGDDEERELAPVSLSYPLGFIRDKICIARGLPWLNAIVVNGTTWYPGHSFLPEGTTIDDKDALVLWRGVVLSVFAYPWETLKLA